jgi:hypothetical protein
MLFGMRVSSRCSAFEKLDVAKWKTSYFEGSGALDKRALKILFDTYWTSRGWKREDEYRVSPEDFAYAKAQGVMFEPIKIEHAQILTRISNAISKLDCRRVADAFLASLSTRRLDLRSVLGSYAVFQHLPHHDPNGVGRRCGICGLDWSVDLENLNVLNFERLKWGGVRHSNPTYDIEHDESRPKYHLRIVGRGTYQNRHHGRLGVRAATWRVWQSMQSR